MKLNGMTTRGVALLMGGVLAATATMPGLARADDAKDKERNYKIGAAVLGAVSVYSILKGKEAIGAIAGAGAYYAYKKGQKAGEEYYGNYPNDDRYSQYPDSRYPDSRYPDSRYPSDSNYPSGTYGNYGNYPDGTAYPTGNSSYPTPYPNGGSYGDPYYGQYGNTNNDYNGNDVYGTPRYMKKPENKPAPNKNSRDGRNQNGRHRLK